MTHASGLNNAQPTTKTQLPLTPPGTLAWTQRYYGTLRNAILAMERKVPGGRPFGGFAHVQGIYSHRVAGTTWTRPEMDG